MTKTVYKLTASCTYDDIKIGNIYIGKVARIEKYGIFVNLNQHIRGLIKKDLIKRKNVMKYKVSQEIYVKVLDVRPEKSEIDLEEVIINEPVKIVEVKKYIQRSLIKDLYENPNFDTVYKIIGKVRKIIQTSGPTVFHIIDESGTIPTVAQAPIPGIRAYPEIEEGDLVEIFGKLNIHESELQILVSQMKKLDKNKYSKFTDAIEQYIDRLATPERIQPRVNSEIIKKLWPRMIQAAKLIRKAIIENRPILIRHHSDCDGYSAAICLERAIIKKIKETNIIDESEWYYYRRQPTKIPYYHTEDMVRDLCEIEEDVKKFGNKRPLVIVLDNGSTLQDLPVYKQLKTLDMQIIVVDHHEPDLKPNKTGIIDDYVDVHINPYLVGGDSNITAGMLGFELARLIDKSVERDLQHIPAIAGIADKSEAPELQEYIKIAKEKAPDFTEDFLKKIGEVIDYITFYLKFRPGRYYINYFFGLDIEKRKFRQLIDQTYSTIRKISKNYKQWSQKYVKIKRLENGIFVIFANAELYMFRSEFPAPGKASTLIKEYFEEKYGKDTPFVLITYGPDFIIFRATDILEMEYGFSVKKIINILRSKYPWAQVDGGGHKVVGTIKFLEGYKEDIIKEILNYLNSLKKQKY